MLPCYKCRNTDRQDVSTQKMRSSLASVATCSKIPKVCSFAGFVDDSCYKEIPINKGLTSIFQEIVATVASTSSTFSFLSRLVFIYSIFIF